MHDIQPRTVAMLPDLLRALKQKGYRIVHVTADRRDTDVALARLEEPQSRGFQVVMARTRQKLIVLTAERAPAPQNPPVVTAGAPAAVTEPVRLAARGFETLSLRGAMR